MLDFNFFKCDLAYFNIIILKTIVCEDSFDVRHLSGERSFSCHTLYKRIYIGYAKAAFKIVAASLEARGAFKIITAGL